MELIDTHTHLYAKDFDADRDILLSEANEAGVRKFLMPNIDSTSIDAMLTVEATYAGQCLPMMGLHPTSVKNKWEEEMEVVEHWFTQRKFIAVGETGIDLYWDKTFIEEQKKVFIRQAGIAVEKNIPLVIHTRESFDITIELLEGLKERPAGVFHCFTGTAEQARQAISLGFHLGIGGVVTFKNGGIDKVLPDLPLDRLVLETDAPYLAPVPHRGKRNNPAYLRLVAEKISEALNMQIEDVAAVTTANAKKLFTLD